METPTLYVKRGCPYCKAAMNYLEQQGISYRPVDVRDDALAMENLRKISGQNRTPTLLWNGDVLADFGTSELVEFLAARPLR